MYCTLQFLRGLSLSIIDYILTHLAPKHPKYCRINLTKKQEEIDFCYKKR
ncbi:hypothetical protein RCEC007_450014 [Escherichia coli]|nr:hypothetical protein RCEC007_450014 [Escherichia coli]